MKKGQSDLEARKTSPKNQQKKVTSLHDSTIEEIESSLSKLDNKLKVISKNIATHNRSYQETLYDSRYFTQEAKQAAAQSSPKFAASPISPVHKQNTTQTKKTNLTTSSAQSVQYVKIKKFLSQIAQSSNSYSFNQLIRNLRERIENAQKLTVEIEEKYIRGQKLQRSLENQVIRMEQLIKQERLKNQYADTIFKELKKYHGQQLPSFLKKSTDQAVQAQANLTSGGPSLTSLIISTQQNNHHHHKSIEQIKQMEEQPILIGKSYNDASLSEQVMHLKGLDERQLSIKQREQEFSLLQTRFLNKVQQKKRELQQFAGDLKQTKRDLDQKQDKINEKEVTLNRLTQNLKKQQKFINKKLAEIQEQQMKIDFLQGNFSEKQMIINKQIESLQKREEVFSKQNLDKSLQFQKKQDELREKELKLVDKEKRLAELQLKQSMIENQLQTLSQSEYSLLKSQAQVKSRQKQLQQREKQIQDSQKKFNFRVQDLSKAFKIVQIQKSQLNDNENQLNLQKLAMEEIEQKFLQQKTEEIETIKKKSLQLIMQKDALNKQRSEIQILSKKIDFKQSLINDQTPYNINKKQKQLKEKELELLEKELQIEIQKEEMENKIDEIFSLLGQLTQWTSLPLPFTSRKQYSQVAKSLSSISDLKNQIIEKHEVDQKVGDDDEGGNENNLLKKQQSKESLKSSAYLDAIEKMQSNLSKSQEKKVLLV